MNIIIIGNAISLAGAALMVAVGFLKTRRSILLTQCTMFGLMGVANIILGGMTGAVSSLVSIIRNLFCLKGPLSVPVKLLVIGIQILLSVKVNTLGWIGYSLEENVNAQYVRVTVKVRGVWTFMNEIEVY